MVLRKTDIDRDLVSRRIAGEGLPAEYEALFWQGIVPLGQRLACLRARMGGPVVVGVNGAQGSGKTTLCGFLAEFVLPALGFGAVTLSLDDFYLGKAARVALAREVHPLLATRGVPGTHDVAALQAAIQALREGALPVLLPRFAKEMDDLRPRDEWQWLDTTPDIILLEGWCIGAVPQAEADLVPPVNALEAQEDEDGRWRRFVNRQLAGPYRDLFARIDALVMLRVADFDSVWEGRKRQEDTLRQRAGAAGTQVMSDDALRRFLQHYERLTRHMLAEMPARADAVVEKGALLCRGVLDEG